MGFLSDNMDGFMQNYYEKCKTIVSQKDTPMEIIIKPEALDISNIQEGEGNKNLYRLTSFDQYIGQGEAKSRVFDYIKGSQQFKETFCHTLIVGPSGFGKTTFALILANMLDKKFISCTAGEIKTEQQVVDKIVACEGGILFLDEAHRISTRVGTFLLPVLEDFIIQDKKINPFTLIFSTTHLGNISKNLEALIQRFPLQINLKHYTVAELITILKQYQQKRYVSIDIQNCVFNEIALNCRNTPRIALTFLREYAYCLDLKKVLSNNQIIKDGITENDVKVLKYLNSTNGAGKASIAKYLRVEPNTYEFAIESFLIYKEFIIISSKRKITEQGQQFLKENEKFL